MNILIFALLFLLVGFCCCCAGFFIASIAYYGAEGLPTRSGSQTIVTRIQPSTPYPTYTPLPTYTSLPTYTPLSTCTPLPTYTPFPTIEPTAVLTQTQTSVASEATLMAGLGSITPSGTATLTPSPSSTPSPSPTFSPSPPPPCYCIIDEKNCESFESQSLAQACFDYCRDLGYGDIHGLDANGNLTVCEDYQY